MAEKPRGGSLGAGVSFGPGPDFGRRVGVRRGTTTIELMVSFALLTTVLGASLPLVVRHGQILASARQYRLALDELCNQAERITALGREDAELAVNNLTPSAFAETHLPGADLNAVVSPADGSDRVTLSLTWDEPGRRSAPLSLVAWLPHDAESPTKSTTGEETP